MLTVGDKFPHFTVDACVGLGKDGFKKITNDTYKNKWVCYFFYPKDFTFVCPTELVEFGKKIKEFKDRDCELVSGSTDNEFSHQAWRNAHADLKDLPYAMINAARLAFDLGIVHPQANACLRATFIVDPEGTIQWASANPLPVGRSVVEVLRVLDAIQTKELCPCDWKPGQPTLK
ncbi:MAG: peroxiredoxin [Planctomycetes bacterium]|jgi:peroxiredoxin (alkyl hydroperoxide reductase subunit C)|nr:peroxiredoxin [Planctomycetota bacterium]